jgi:hypothetical protein
METVFLLLPTLALMASAGLLIVFLKLFRNRLDAKPKPPPQSKRGLRPPGFLLAAELDRLDREILLCSIASFVLPLLVCAAVVIPRLAPHPDIGAIAIGGAAVVGTGIYAACLSRLVRLMKKRRNVRLGREGELSVGGELEKLEKDGYRVFHNVPADGFAVDHVVVGGSGVFTVETRTQPGAEKPGGVKRRTVDYNGRLLFFPRWTDEQTIFEAERQADRLSSWLELSAGIEVAARAVVAIPGWYVRRTSPEGIPVVNPAQIPSLFKYIVPRPLDRRQVERIAEFLGRVCRLSEDAAGSPPD